MRRIGTVSGDDRLEAFQRTLLRASRLPIPQLLELLGQVGRKRFIDDDGGPIVGTLAEETVQQKARVIERHQRMLTAKLACKEAFDKGHRTIHAEWKLRSHHKRNPLV